MWLVAGKLMKGLKAEARIFKPLMYPKFPGCDTLQEIRPLCIASIAINGQASISQGLSFQTRLMGQIGKDDLLSHHIEKMRSSSNVAELQCNMTERRAHSLFRHLWASRHKTLFATIETTVSWLHLGYSCSEVNC